MPFLKYCALHILMIVLLDMRRYPVQKSIEGEIVVMWQKKWQGREKMYEVCEPLRYEEGEGRSMWREKILWIL